MAYSAKHLREELGDDMEREQEHVCGVRRLSEEERDARNAGRQLAQDSHEDSDADKQLAWAVGEMKRLVDEQKRGNDKMQRQMSRMVYEMRGMVDEVERICADAKDVEHAAQQAALNGVDKAQQRAEEITVKNIEDASERSRKAIDSMVQESKRRIERLGMITLPDRLFYFGKWTALMMVLFLLAHFVWQAVA